MNMIKKCIDLIKLLELSMGGRKHFLAVFSERTHGWTVVCGRRYTSAVFDKVCIPGPLPVEVIIHELFLISERLSTLVCGPWKKTLSETGFLNRDCGRRPQVNLRSRAPCSNTIGRGVQPDQWRPGTGA